ncbi:MAG: phosphoribosylanthranilate isomerase [Methyloceanibacter sp.]
MSVKIKICGVRTPDIVETASEAGADFIGFVLFDKSPRHVSLETARVLALAARGRIRTAAVLVDPDDALIDRLAEIVTPDLVQLHGNETPARVASIKARTARPVMKAIPVAAASDVARAEAYAEIADYILFDAKAVPGTVVPGGHGVPFDWRKLAGARSPFALSGGLNAANVAAAIGMTRASLVDVSSGVETAPGVKDPDLVRNFICAARFVGQQPAKAS